MSDVAPGGERRPIVLSDGVVELPPCQRSDAAFLYGASRDPAIERFNAPTPTSPSEAISVIERFEACWNTFATDHDPTRVAFAIIDAASGDAVGICGVDDWSSERNAQFGYWLAAGARRRGFATRAAVLMTNWLFELGAARVFVTIHPENTASAAVARRACFASEGALREHGIRGPWRNDVDVFAVRRA